MFQTSVVLISAEGSEAVYRSMEEVPARLRTKLLKSTNGGNSATILIADRKGRREIAKALGNLPGTANRRMRRVVLGTESGPGWLTPVRKRALLAALVILVLVALSLVYTYRW
jgi:hypothetical protein